MTLARRTCALLLVAVALGACGGKPQLGAGSDVGFCDGWQELDALPEPPLDDKAEVLRWADGARRILGRIDPKVKVTIDRKERPLPAEVVTDLGAVEEELDRFRSSVAEAGDDAAVRRAVSDLSRGFDTTADRITRAHGMLCQR